MTWTLIDHKSKKSDGSATTDALNTTGADLLVVALTDYYNGTTVSDSKSNAGWTPLTSYQAVGGYVETRIVWCVPEAGKTGSGHTFTATTTNLHSEIHAFAFSGANASPYDKESGSPTDGNSGLTSRATGSITPAANDSLIVSAATGFGDGATYTNNAGLSQLDGLVYSGGCASAMGWLAQSGAPSAINVTWSSNTSGWYLSAAIAAFKPATGGGGTETQITPAKADLALTAYAPVLVKTTNRTIAPGPSALAIASYAPKVSRSTTIAPGASALVITGYSPGVVLAAPAITKTPGAAALSLTSYAPVVVRSQNIVRTPGKGDLALTAYAPTVVRRDFKTILPGPAALSITGYAPLLELTKGETITPERASLVLSVTAPVVVQTHHQISRPDPAEIVITAYAPALEQSRHIIINPETGALVITGYAPGVEVASQSPTISPGMASLILEAYAPLVVNSGEVVEERAGQVPAGARRRTRRFLVEVDGEEFMADSVEEIRSLIADKVKEVPVVKTGKRGRPRKVIIDVPRIEVDGEDVSDLKVWGFDLGRALQERKEVETVAIQRAILRRLEDMDDEEAAMVVL